MYTDSSDPMLNWDAEDLRMAFEVAGLIVEVVLKPSLTQMHITSAFLNRLFTTGTKRPSYLDRLALTLKPQELTAIKEVFSKYLLNQTVNWESSIAFVLSLDSFMLTNYPDLISNLSEIRKSAQENTRYSSA
jgi:putative ATPase